MNQICITCGIEIDENNYLKDRTVCESCYNKNRRKNNNNVSIQIDRINNNSDNNPNVSTYENHAYVDIGPRNAFNFYYMLRMLEKIGNQRPIHIVTRSPNHYPKNQKSNEIKPIKKNKGSVLFFTDMFGARNGSQLNELYTRGRHEGLSVFYVSHSFFWFAETKH